MGPNSINSKSGKTKGVFKKYYDNNPEFKKRHLKRMSQKITCECGFVTARGNLSRHKKGHLHIQRMGDYDEIVELEEAMEEINQKIKALKKDRSKIKRKLKRMNKKDNE